MTNRFLLLASALFLFVSPGVLQAAEFRGGEQVRLQDRDAIQDNVYVGGADVVVETPVTGDLFVGGGTVRVESAVTGDLFVSGGNIRIEGPVTGDVRIAGGDVVISSNIRGELLIMGGRVEVTSDSQAKNITAFSGQLRMAGATDSIMAGVGELVIEPSARVAGNVEYISKDPAVIAEGATIGGELKHTLPPVSESENKRDGVKAFMGGGIFWILSSLIMMFLFVYFLPHKSAALSTLWREKFGSNVVWGLVFTIVTPIVGLLLIVSLIGFPLGAGVFFLYGFAMYVGKLVATIALGMYLYTFLSKQNAGKSIHWAAIFIGAVAMIILGVIPVLGWIALCVMSLAGIGALVSYDWELYKRLKASKEF